ncbi:hypothetical protein CcaverHIS002_0302270 [Cutaneotrichosporon cavernicola]|uniref:C-CAP/cofactor C-like domain-containing protein n=1 Tax=Cutaneotrichosporon cavernicola TaxID=279322 RepID=A0AA48KZ70_9TREE|nr:uncharacterized protein CcaverHIS019_0302240 [Cutaneotrichosporon cavernicola]BEI82359.1 hypothetical protein CcaverHIS002_0302270 [Cutaneotrichosporon cavernicola]BEI90154.1 hypothetical protein CcaverHIS019_0302240 [Cutaneotrichosporon cavernicola]BEI97932.1 hypothetical protein CcaverHIS631_0302310 [Cutaneotrichosporon cavernicola]
MASTSDAAAFYATFQQLKGETADALSRSAADSAPKLAALRSALADARATLPSYDQRSYDLQVRELEARLASLRAEKPKSRFAFKRPASKPTSGTASRAQSASPAPPLSKSSTPAPPATTYTLSAQRGRILVPDYPDEASYTLTLADLDDCIIDLRSSPALTSLHARGLRSCVVLAPVMAGSAMLSDLQRCIVAVGAQQFRLHDTTDCVLLLHVASLPVVERCKGVRFGPYPFQAGGESRHEQVQDFDWVRPGPSPHWYLLSPDQAEILRSSIHASPTSTAEQLLALAP